MPSASPAPRRCRPLGDGRGQRSTTAPRHCPRGWRHDGCSSRGGGYGALLPAVANADADIIVFLDADFSEEPEQITTFWRRSRPRGRLRPRTRVVPDGLARAARHARPRRCINLLWGTANRPGAFQGDPAPVAGRPSHDRPDVGWTIEMQVKAAELRSVPSSPVRTRRDRALQDLRLSRGTMRAATRMIAMNRLAPADTARRHGRREARAGRRVGQLGWLRSRFARDSAAGQPWPTSTPVLPPSPSRDLGRRSQEPGAGAQPLERRGSHRHRQGTRSPTSRRRTIRQQLDPQSERLGASSVFSEHALVPHGISSKSRAPAASGQ